MKYRIKIAPGVDKRISAHIEFLARVSKVAAQKLAGTLIQDIYSLEELPLRNPAYNNSADPPEKYRYLVSNNKYRIVYQVAEHTVYIYDIQDCRQSGENNLVD
ncbi:MAG: type II toxin-antitoxin system RelE/ParE family toxin [Candidatus Margulisbacteria bacterium]|jgi:mRNA-degrading endonuclease RelE of RelBE toxin-antitoxin system|nr:type II toxin-antitoxin system RelE/ParE family toxin [Candidatus Margulisiibacteriota bacterium]